MAYGGDAVGRFFDGKVCFVPFAAPGDVLRVRRTGDRKRFARAAIASVVKAGPDRVTPRCTRFGTCGGCAWQHVNYAAQTTAKDRQLAALWARGPQPHAPLAPIEPAPDPWHYRDRVTPAFDTAALGFFAAGSQRMVPTPDCALAAPALEQRLAALTPALLAPFAAAGEDRITLRHSHDGTVDAYVWRQHGMARGNVDNNAMATLAAALMVRGVATAGGQTWGTPGCTVDVGGLVLHAAPGVFTQVHAAINRRIVTAVLAALSDCDGPILDLYCGIGNFTLPLAAAGHTVRGVEANRVAIADAKANAARLQLHERSSFKVADLDDAAVAKRTVAAARPTAVVLDPPRAGAARVMAAIATAKPRTVVYVSCHPPACLRDLAVLTHVGYRITAATPYDMFPQTGHIELLVVLHRP